MLGVWAGRGCVRTAVSSPVDTHNATRVHVSRQAEPASPGGPGGGVTGCFTSES